MTRLLPALLALSLLAVVPLGAQPLTLNCGTPVQATAYPETPVTFSFTADPGESDSLRFVSLATTLNIDVTVLQAGTTEVKPRDASIPKGIVNSYDYDFVGGGGFIVRVKTLSSQSAPFLIVLSRLNRPCGKLTLACGIPVTAPIAAAGQVQSVQFTGAAGDIYSLRLIGSDLDPKTATDPSTTMYGVLYDANGKLQQIPDPARPTSNKTVFFGWSPAGFSPLDFTVPAAGTYTALIYEGTNGKRTANLKLVMARLNGPCSSTAVKCGSTKDNTLADPVAIDSYTLQADAGDVYLLKAARSDTSGKFVPAADVYDPSGKLVTTLSLQPSAPHLLSSGTVTAPAAGTYVVLLHDANYVQSGGYSLAAARVNKPCGDSPLGCGAVTDARIDGVLRFSTYSVAASAGDAYLLRMIRTDTTGNFKPRLEVYDAQGNTATVISGTDLTRGVFNAATAGTYTLLAWDGYDGGQSGPFTFSVTRLNRPCNAAPLGCGAATTASISGTLRQAAFAWSAAAAESFTVRMVDTNSTLKPSMEVYDPNGQQVGQASSGSALNVDVLRPAGGNYTVLALSGASGQGPFTIEALRTRNACGASPPQGQSLPGVVSTASPYVSYSLPASAGDSLLVRAASSTTFGANMDLYDPDGVRLSSSTFGFTQRAAATGNYTVVLSATDPHTGGAYTFTWQRLNQPAGTAPLICGANTPGLLTAANQFRYYTTPVGPGDLLKLVLTRASGSFTPQMELYDPNGARLAFNGTEIDQKAAALGNYLVVVSPSTARFDAGDYVLAYQRPNNPCSVQNLSCGQSLLRTVSAPGQMDAYVFSGTTGDRMTMRLVTRSGDFSSFAELYDPTGSLVLSAASGQLTTVLAADGPYAVLVRDRLGPGTGTYRASLQRDFNPCAVDDSQPPTISLQRPTGGEVLIGGSSFHIAWQSDDNVDLAGHEIRYSSDGGQTFPTVIVGLGSAAQVYDWIPPANLTPTRDARIRVTATDTAGNSQSATSGALSAIGSGFTENANVSYTYDGLNRVTSAGYSDGRTIWYTYDAAGNLVQIIVSQ